MRCPSCGNENREEARFCDSCGATLEEASAPDAPEQESLQADGVAALPAGSPSEVAGRYAVKGFLGQGGRKHVYLADDPETSREVAVAVFDTEGAAAAVGARARREAQAMGKLAGHPHVVDVYDTGEHRRQPLHRQRVHGRRRRRGPPRRRGRPAPRSAARDRDRHRRRARRSSTRTGAASSTATSSPPTSGSPRTARRGSATSDLRPPRGARGSAKLGRWSARSPTCRPSRRSVRPRGRAPTSTRSARCSTRC